MNQGQFYYFLCNEGSESFLKEEIKLFHSELKFAYSTKGFLTFKSSQKINLENKDFVFCRHFGEYVNRGPKKLIFKEFENLKSPKNFYSLKGEIFSSDDFENGEVVHELIQVNEDEFYLGKFRSRFNNAQAPGGWPLIGLPSEAPSRAYLKILEGAQRVGVEFLPNDVALEIGSSPGGATFALLNLGLTVMGVDPGLMDERCFTFKNFVHYQKSIQEFNVNLIDKKVDWLLVDMNLAPEASLNEIEKVFLKIKQDLKGAFITLKMTKLSLVTRLPFYKKLIERMGLKVKLMTQLPSHKQEFLLYVERS